MSESLEELIEWLDKADLYQMLYRQRYGPEDDPMFKFEESSLKYHEKMMNMNNFMPVSEFKRVSRRVDDDYKG